MRMRYFQSRGILCNSLSRGSSDSTFSGTAHLQQWVMYWKNYLLKLLGCVLMLRQCRHLKLPLYCIYGFGQKLKRNWYACQRFLDTQIFTCNSTKVGTSVNFSITEAGGHASFSHCVDVDEERTYQQTKPTVLYREQFSGHWLNSIPEGNKQSHRINFQTQHLCFCSKRHLPDDSWTNDFERLFSLEREASPVFPSTEVLLHEPWVVSSEVSLKFGFWKKTR